MNLVELITKYQTDATPEQMVQVTKIIGKFVAMHATDEDLLLLYKEIYGVVGNGHFNDFFAEAQIKKMVLRMIRRWSIVLLTIPWRRRRKYMRR